MNRSVIAASVYITLFFAMPILYGGPAPKNKISHLTFSHPVQIPGATLPAGTYTFSLVNSSGHRGIVRVTNQRGDKIFATILSLPDYRTKATSHTVILFGEKAPCEEATPIKAWFYPNETFGYRFVYPKAQAAEIATTCNEPVPETPDETASDANLTPDQLRVLEKTSVYLVTPGKQEEKYDLAELSTGDQSDRGGFDAGKEQ